MSAPEEQIAAYFRDLAAAATSLAGEWTASLAEIAALTARTLEAGNKLLFCGNGGSAADAQHLATEYVVRFRRERPALPAIALTTDTSLLTAASNDFGYEHVFSRQIEALGNPGDILFLHSTSGESPNLLAAAHAAKKRGVVTVAVLARGGGRLRALVDHPLVLPVDHSAHAQELQIAIGHVICHLVEEGVATRPAGG
jgi:D-sedoheptulose 7-phosphate isomerase